MKTATPTSAEPIGTRADGASLGWAAARWRLLAGIVLWRMGAWPLVTLLLLAAAGWLQFVERPELRGRLAAAAEARVAAPPSAAEDQRRRTMADDSQRLADFRAVLPPGAEATERVQQLVALTHQELAWKQAEFVHTEDKALALQRLQVSVPVTGAYPRLRAGLDAALREVPNLSIDQVLFQRQTTGESDLQARVRLSLWFSAVPALALPAQERGPKP